MRICLACDATLAGSWRCGQCGHEPVADGGLKLFAPELADGIPDDADHHYDALVQAEGRHFWFQARIRLILWSLRRYFSSTRSFLEIGCGTGLLLAEVSRCFPSWSLVGSDAVVAGLQHASCRLENVELIQMDGRRLPFKNEFDLIGALDVLEHVSEDELVLERIFAALKPGGGLILTVPQHTFLWSELDECSGHKRRYSRRELLAKLDRAGFDVVRVTSFVSILLPLLYLSRLSRGTRREGKVNMLREIEISSFLNLLFGVSMSLELVLIKLGLSLPAGGSLLVLARRPGSDSSDHSIEIETTERSPR